MIQSTQTRGPRRESFHLSRSLEFLSEQELAKQIGYDRDYWPLVIAKELIDNSLDACEEVDTLPDISLVVTESSIEVTDNGPGFPPDTIRGMLDFNVRESSRNAYRSLTRGAQGNAGKCIIAAPFVLADGTPDPVIIESLGVRHEIRVTVDRLAQEPRVEHAMEPSNVKSGTRVYVPLACSIDDAQQDEFLHLARGYVAVNPHLQLSICVDFFDHVFERTSEQCTKWTSAHPDPPAWYDLPAFERLVASCVHKDRQNGDDRPLGKFLATFAGLRGSAACRTVAAEAGLTRCRLSALVNGDGLDSAKTRTILNAMQAHTTAPKPKKLGLIGRQHTQRTLDQWTHLAGEVTYKAICGEVDGLPFTVEAAFAVKEDRDQDCDLFAAVNFSPTVRSFSRAIEWELQEQYVYNSSPVVVLVHVATPAPEYTNHGKTALALKGDISEALGKCIRSVTAAWAKEARNRTRDAQRAPKLVRRPKAKKTSIRAACFAVMEQAVAKASSGGECRGFSARDLYYAARALMQEHTPASLTQAYFEQIVDQWEIEHGLIPGRYREARGHLSEPHSDKRTPLGTREVDDYAIPEHEYQAIVYIEKRGLESQLLWGRIPQRYDVAIMASEGYASRAGKALMQAAQRGHKIKVICFHDADPAGYEIFRTLAQSSGAHEFSFQVFDAGLHLEEALEMGLATETFVRKKALPKNLELTKLEREYFTGKSFTLKDDKKAWRAQRVELNALSCDPAKFCQWVESKLHQFGITKKLVPGNSVVSQTAEVVRDVLATRRVIEFLRRMLDFEEMARCVVEQVRDRVSLDGIRDELVKWAAGLPAAGWRGQLDYIVNARVDGIAEEIERLAHEQIKGPAP